MATRRGKNLRGLIPLLVVLGPTASGKTMWVNYLAKKFKGEVITADSRQVYKYFSIGTNKVKGIWQKDTSSPRYIVGGVTYHMVDFVSPKSDFSVYEYQKKAEKIIAEIHERGFLPCLSGGTGMYVDAVVQNWQLAKKSYSKRLRDELSAKPTIELLRRLEKIDPTAAKRIDMHNRARLIRAVEINELTGVNIKTRPSQGKKLYRTLKIGITIARDKLYKKIDRRVDQMFHDGFLREVQKLYARYPKELIVFFSIGYKELIDYIEGSVSLSEAQESIKKNTRRYAKRQLTWWRRDKEIYWCNTKTEAEALVKAFLKDV